MPQSGLPRNVEVYDLSDPDGNRELVAGLAQLGTTTIAEFYQCLEICFQVPQPLSFRLVDEQDVVLARESGNMIVPVGTYAVISLYDPSHYIAVTLSPEVARTRALSGGSPATPATSTFRERVRLRDGACVISQYNTSLLGFLGLEAAHIIPRSHFEYVRPLNCSLSIFIVGQQPVESTSCPSRSVSE